MPSIESVTAPGLAVALPESALDMVPLGVAKVSGHEAITYGNRKLLQITGLPDWRGRTLSDVFCEEDLITVRKVLKERFEQRLASEYRIDITRYDDGRKVPVSITSFPETNEHNDVVGTLALVRDLTVEMAQKQMYQLVEKESDGARLLDAIAESLRPWVPFDRISVIRLNEERTHLRTIYDQGEAPKTSFRWWRIPPAVKDLLNCSEILVIDDIPTWYDAPERRSMLDDPAVQEFLKLGLVSTLSMPVRQNGAQVASIVLYRKKGHPFSGAEQGVVNDLPLAEAVSVALRNEKESNLNFLLDLIKQILSAYGSVKTVAQMIVGKIAEHYEWDYVSIYQAYEHTGQCRMIAETATKDGVALPEEERTSFSINEGIIGHVFRTGQGVSIEDIGESKEFRDIYIPRAGIKTRSELCVPIGKEVRWVLNVEDEQSNAFAPQEKRDLEDIAASLSSLLQRTLDYQYRTAVVERANDAIILTDIEGLIREVNPATCSLLRAPEEMIVRHPIEAFFADPEDAQALLKCVAFPNHEALMQRPLPAATAAETQVKVLLSVATLPGDTGGKIFIASDMTQFKRMQQLELAQDVYREVTGQIKTPMSLAIAWLRRFAQGKKTDGEDMAHKVIQQLQKAELTLDRLLLVERGDGVEIRHEVLISVNDLVDSIMQDMPERERDVVTATTLAPDDAHLRADAYEMRYCLQTVLSYLLRLAAEDDRIELDATRDGDGVAFALRGRAADVESVSDIESECRAAQVRAEISLGKETLIKIAGRNRGTFAEIIAPGGQQVTFRFAFPVVATGVPS